MATESDEKDLGKAGWLTPGRRKVLIIAVLGLLIVLYLLRPSEPPAITQVVENGVATGLSPEELAGIKQGVLAAVSRMVEHDRFGGSRKPCTDYFTIGEPTILDAALSGTTGKIKVRVPVTAANPVDLGPTVDSHYRYYYPTDNCYGAPPGGWTQWKSAPRDYEVTVEKWQSGWRLAEQQPDLSQR